VIHLVLDVIAWTYVITSILGHLAGVTLEGEDDP
jgi:hypothetical protein